ncbi:MAG TPA: AAA family ATPase [Ktedonobacterales bacterium]|nr:AAA family ATPase [Ktedonobacterales bacterium]
MTTSTSKPKRRAVKLAPSPINPDAERATLGGLLIDAADGPPSPYVQRWIDLLEAGDFYVPEHADVFAAIQTVHGAGQPVELQTVQEAQRQAGSLHDRGVMLSSLVASCTTSANTPFYARIVLENAVARQRMFVGNDLMLGKITAQETIARLQALEGRLDLVESQALTLRALLAEDVPPTRWVVPTLIPEGLTILGAKMKIGKSWLAYGLSIAAGLGGVFLGQRIDRCDVLYLALEDGKRRLQERGRKLLAGSAAPDGLYIETLWPRLDKGGLLRLDRWLGEHPDARLVIIDVFQRVRPPLPKYGDGYAEDYHVLSGLKTLADTHHAAILVVHHTRKAAADDIFEELLGSAGIGGAADTVLLLARKRGEQDAELHITGREIERETTYAVRFDPETCAWQFLGEAQEVALSQKRQRILEAVASFGGKRGSDGATPKNVARRMDDNYNTIKNMMLKMAQAGQLLAFGDGTYDVSAECRSLRSLRSLDPTEAASDAESGRSLSDYAPEGDRSLRSLNGRAADETIADYADYGPLDSVVSRSLTGTQAPSGAKAPQTTETTETTPFQQVRNTTGRAAGPDADSFEQALPSVTSVTASEYAHAQRNGHTPADPGPMTRRWRELVAQGMDSGAAASQAMRERGTLPEREGA